MVAAFHPNLAEDTSSSEQDSLQDSDDVEGEEDKRLVCMMFVIYIYVF